MDNEQNTQPAAAPAETPMPALDIVLASASPRRKQLLEDAGVRFVVHASEVDETLEPDLLADPPEACKKLAERKAGAVVQEVLAEDYTGMAAVIGADTMVVCEGEIFGKPVSLSDAKRMLRCLSGRTHEVLTAVSVWMVAAPEPENISLGFRTFVDRSAVTFRELTDEEIVDYLRKGESFDKAGAYAVQGAGADLVARVDGAMDTVIGLPVGRLLEEFPDFAGGATVRPAHDSTLGGCAARSLSRVEGSHIEMRFACALPTIPRAATALADLLRQPMAFSTYRPSSHCEM